jgi:hypothetical protein
MKKHNLDVCWIQYSEKELEENAKLFSQAEWNWISSRQIISQRFIEKYSDKIDWGWISERQNLSEEFMEKHQNKISWCYISRYQKLSEKFIIKHIDKIEIDCLINNSYISRKLKKQIKKEYEQLKLLKEII